MHGYSKGTATDVASSWAFSIFLSAADLVMILRVYAMWNQSKCILWVLVFIYVPQVILSLVVLGIYYNPNTYLSVTVIQVLDFSVCDASFGNGASIAYLYTTIPRVTLSVTLLILALIITLKESVDMYRETKQWQPNRYMKQLMKDQIIYFLVYVSPFPALLIPIIPINSTACLTLEHLHNKLITWIFFPSTSRYTLYNITILIQIQKGLTAINTWQLFLDLICYTTICPIMPRFIISVRELYDRDLHACCQGVDSGFGVLSQPRFAGAPTEQGHSQVEEEAVEATPVEELSDNTYQVADGDANNSEVIRLEILGDDGTQQV
ncbi:hypothetical protein HD554DRAFT_2175860 [Boletus coccyginus]|nr:hypothetical protein HD554DRAFT_2175860 [Boletus coccyginus]